MKGDLIADRGVSSSSPKLNRYELSAGDFNGGSERPFMDDIMTSIAGDILTLRPQLV